MTIHIRDKKADALARRLAGLTGETLTQAVTAALEARLTEVERAARQKGRMRQVDEILAAIDALPVLDDRPADEILGYNEKGHFD